MTAAELRQALAEVGLVRRIYYFPEVASTLDWGKSLAARTQGSRDLHGTLVIADHQTKGRGRLGRAWVAPAGSSLLFTLLLHEDELPPTAESLCEVQATGRLVSIAAPVAVRNAIARCTTKKVSLKYPNDILSNGRKVSGVLTESVRHQHGSILLVGIGVNVHQDQSQLPATDHLVATSVYIESGAHVRRPQLLQNILSELQGLLAAPHQALQQMVLHCDTIGRQVTVSTAQGNVVGIACGVDADGALIVRLPTGVEQTIHSGDVIQLDPATITHSTT